MATIIEAAHRVTSGVAVVAVVALFVMTRRTLPKGHRARRGAALATVSIFGEALIGAGLVLFELVAHDASMKRALSMVLHLGNTFVLLAALALTAWWTSSPVGDPVEAKGRGNGLTRGVIVLALGAVLLLGSSGAVAALGDTLFPATSLREGLAQDLSPVAHAFLRLRMLHPILALGAGVVVLAAAGLVRSTSGSPDARRLARGVTILFVCQFAIGLLNVSLLAPIAVQLIHLLFADLTWIALVLMGFTAWSVRAPASAPAPGGTALAA